MMAASNISNSETKTITDDVVIAKELDSIHVVGVGKDDNSKNTTTIRIFSLSLNNVTVIVSSLGASIMKLLVPKTNKVKQEQNDNVNNHNYDDIVLGYQSSKEQYDTNNPYYFHVTVGRVANRIVNGKLHINNQTYQLECNNPPYNHLHGGFNGLWNQNWNASIISIKNDDNTNNPAIQFTIISNDMDQGYPGTIEINTIYSFHSTSIPNAVTLRVQNHVQLLSPSPSVSSSTVVFETPINLAQHYYFNLYHHNAKNGILDHSLRLNCSHYTPLDYITSIPTREVVNVINTKKNKNNVMENDNRDINETTVMDFTNHSRLLKDALMEYGIYKSGLSIQQANEHIQQRLISSKHISLDSNNNPYGYDHNYIIDKPILSSSVDSMSKDHQKQLNLVGVLQTKYRRLTISTNVPGVQLYTSNYLNGTEEDCSYKDNVKAYGQWQGICLETQHYPNSINVDETLHPEFAKGKCILLSMEHPYYQRDIEYCIESYNDTDDRHHHSGGGDDDDIEHDESPSDQLVALKGSDTLGQKYESLNEMWILQGTKADWYERSINYYEYNCDNTIDGVLGGYGSISDIDIIGSIEFISCIQSIRPSFLQWNNNTNSTKNIACECGAGIGRLTKHLLLSSLYNNILHIDSCHLIESSSRLLSSAPDFIGEPIASTKCLYYCTSLQNWEPIYNTYCIMWIQWVLIYLMDDDIIQFLIRCCHALVDDGLIILKENVIGTNNDQDEEDFQLDVDDASVTRSNRYWRYLINQAGLRIVYTKTQNNFPNELFPVRMYALERK